MARKPSRLEFAVIGLGRFGRSVALNLIERGHTVLGIDRDPNIVQQLADRMTQVVALDSSNEDALRAVDIVSFDTVVVAIGSQFEANLMTTVALKQLGVKRVVCKALNERQQYILTRVGADMVVLPEHEAGARLAWQLSEPHVLEHLNLGHGFSVAEVKVPAPLVGQTLMQSGLRRRYGINVLAINHNGKMIVTPPPDYVFKRDDRILIIGADASISTFCDLSS
ncbi:TrkA family potassium uptake protein [Chloroflexus sp.]|uniref:potassium channel family protein n=1 Tax=Chloroflexus sp. TaxID=1904827 RepID=UPI00298EE035|nr:TrkA family potassium uptake protein [Chloroflexus sp.]MCX7859900.1 TrkA family potassium uptake protein [Chloroflexus sp.]MDW8404387.1 TrkA family potassium uptake protein [Chloroflexus sp.]